ncbi:hypothetical protein BKA61DRAFT_495944, partial [Leptodontidium sp. MPI-SDFR-AT-0119]
EEYVISDWVTLNEILTLAEASKEGTKFKVPYDPFLDLKASKITLLLGRWSDEESIAMMVIFGNWFDEGTFDMKPSRLMNDIFPEIKPISVADIVPAWKGK